MKYVGQILTCDSNFFSSSASSVRRSAAEEVKSDGKAISQRIGRTSVSGVSALNALSALSTPSFMMQRPEMGPPPPPLRHGQFLEPAPNPNLNSTSGPGMN